MSFRNKGTTGSTVIVSREPDYSGNVTCDGTADDVEIQAAMDYLNTVFGGGTLIIKKGIYNLANRVRPAGYTWVLGEGWRTVLHLNDGVNLNVIDPTASYGYIGHLQIDGNGGNQTSGFGVHIYPRDDWTLENLLIYDTYSDAVYIRSSDRIIVRNCELIDSGRHGIGARDGTIWKFESNTIINPTTIGIDIEPIGVETVYDLLIHGNTVEGGSFGVAVGSAAISPHMATSTPVLCPVSMTFFIRKSTPGLK